MANVCLSCHGPAVCLGPLPGCNVFAGRSLSEVLPGGYLYRCRRCLLGFRHPRRAKSELDALYANGVSTTWEWTPSARADWRLAEAAIRAYGNASPSVLDIGCFDGSFLASLDHGATRAGIEIMPEAAAIAERRGVRLLGADFECLRHAADRFDVVTAFDVIEHVEDPFEFLTLLRSASKPGGLLIISTGDLDAQTWRLMKNRYWYCALPEHISFLSERWFRKAAAQLGLEVADCRHYPHSMEPLRRKAQEAISNLTFLMLPKVIGAMRRRGIGHMSAQLHPDVIDEFPPGWASATDHVLIALRTPASARL